MLKQLNNKPPKNSQGKTWIWLNAGSISICILLVVGLIGLIAFHGLAHFWPKDVLLAKYQAEAVSAKNFSEQSIGVAGELADSKTNLIRQLESAGFVLDPVKTAYKRLLLKIGNRDLYGQDFVWLLEDWLVDITYPENLVVVERMEWGNFYGFISAIQTADIKALGLDQVKQAWSGLLNRLAEINHTRTQMKRLEKHDIGDINYQLEQLRLEEKSAQFKAELTPEKQQYIQHQREKLEAQYQVLVKELNILRNAISQDNIQLTTATGESKTIPLYQIVRLYQPNTMSWLQKLRLYFIKLSEFITEYPREANTEGGIFPALFGTMLMVILMSILVTPLGVIAAVYLHEYTRHGLMSRIVRIAVNNLAGVPSVVYGIFGLGFFVYLIGSHIDKAFYAEALPTPTFGTPGLLWASLTLAILTIPVVIVSTEEGLSRVPKAIREGGLALGATKAEVLWRLVIPMASPGIMTGIILAIARAAGEVAPLMLVGAVKLAPNLALDTNPPYLHLDRKFMHLGFHIYDVGFQSPNVEASRPLVYATALLLILIIVVLNFTAVRIRNHLREKYKTLET